MNVAETFLQQLLDENGAPPKIDWERFRIMQLVPGTSGIADPKKRDELVARGFTELAKATFDAESERRSIASLRALLLQILGAQPKVVPGFANALIGPLGAGPQPGTPPNLARLLSALAEILRVAEPLTVTGSDDPLGERMMTLLFVDGAYVGFLPASRALAPGGARA